MDMPPGSDRFGDRAGLVGELLEGELQLPRIDALGLLAEEPLTEDVELMLQRGVLALDGRELRLQAGNERPGGREVADFRLRRTRRRHW
jgi:hypothetical protein